MWGRGGVYAGGVNCHQRGESVKKESATCGRAVSASEVVKAACWTRRMRPATRQTNTPQLNPFVGVILVDPFTRHVLKMMIDSNKGLIHQGVIWNNEPKSAQKCTKKG